jgi:hypothetical protein
MKRLATVVALFLFGQIAASPALAGIADSPLPVLEAGKTTFHLYSVPGIINNGLLTTLFSCTSTDTADMRVGVESFGSAGGSPSNDPVAASFSVLPGGTVTFGCVSAASIAVNSVLSCGPLSRGSARILATSRKLICTAYIVDPGNVPPTSAWQLTIVKGTSQQGE